MTTYGLTPTGFVPKPFTVCRDEIGARHQGLRGPSVDVSDGSLDGNWCAIIAEREAALWALGQAITSAYDPDAATDAAQDGVCALTGTLRRQATSSIVTETLCGIPATPVPAGAIVRTVSTSKDFATTEDGTITLLSSWAITTAYIAGDRVTNSSRCYECITAGTSAGAGGPTTTAVDITDGTVHWQYIGEGTGAIDVEMASIVKDSIVATSRDLTAKQTSVGGWLTAINLLDAELGAPLQSNESLRVTREVEIADAGAGTADAIRGATFKVAGVTAVTVFQNLTDVIDDNGLSPHSTLLLVTGGDDAAIAQVLFENVGSGATTLGSTLVVVSDSQGSPQDYRFQRPVEVTVYADVTLTYNSASPSRGGYPTDGDTQVEDTLALFAQVNQVGGKDAINSSLRASMLPVVVNGVLVAGVQGVIDVTQLLMYTDAIGTPTTWAATTGYVATVGTRSVVTNNGRTYICITSGTSAGSVGPLGTGTDITDGTAHWYFLGNTIVITDFQQAVFDTSRIAVHSSAAGSL